LKKKLSKQANLASKRPQLSSVGLPQHGKFFSTPNTYIIIVVLIPGAKVMVVLSFAKNKFSNFFLISQIQPHQVFLVFFTQNMSQKNFPHKNLAKNNNPNYQNKNRQLNCKQSSLIQLLI